MNKKTISKIKTVAVWTAIIGVSALFVYGVYGIIFDYIRYMK